MVVREEADCPRQDARLLAVERELQDPHAGESEALPQRGHLRRDDAEVLGDDRQVAQLPPHGLEQCPAGHLDPLPLLRGRRACRHRPAGIEAAEVVDAHEIKQPSGGTDALDPEPEPLRARASQSYSGLPQS